MEMWLFFSALAALPMTPTSPSSAPFTPSSSNQPTPLGKLVSKTADKSCGGAGINRSAHPEPASVPKSVHCSSQQGTAPPSGMPAFVVGALINNAAEPGKLDERVFGDPWCVRSGSHARLRATCPTCDVLSVSRRPSGKCHFAFRAI